MKKNYLIGFAAAALLLCLLVLAARYFFETYPAAKYLPPSREARMNEYLALDRWLGSKGIAVRTENYGDLSTVSRAEEKNIFILASLFDWQGDAVVEYFVNWIEEGGTLFLALDRYTSYRGNGRDYWYLDDDGLEFFLEEFGITAGNGGNTDGYRYSKDSPDFDRMISFEVDGGTDALTLKNWGNVTRLVKIKRGKGSLIVTGKPRFLFSSYLENAPNARLAEALFAADGETGWFFIRGKTRAAGLFGSLFREGNFAVLLVSLLVLLVVCFWSVIPVFGLVKEDAEKPGRALRERFLAEGRFLKRYGALEFYRQAYVTEIKRKLKRKEGIAADSDIEKRVSGLFGGGKTLTERDRRLFTRALYKEKFTFREFLGIIIVLKTILEKI